MARRTLIERHGNGRTQIGLDLHALSGPMKILCPSMGAESYALFLDLSHSRQGKYLKPPESVKIGRSQFMNL